jgi:uncharacterized membrane protein YhaH (DUF805 family)
MRGMSPNDIFKPSGRLNPGQFALAVIVVYVLGSASQSLLTGPILAKVGVWPFGAVHAGLLWVWYAIHVNRLRDANRNTGSAVGVLIVNALSLLLLMLIVSLFTTPAQAGESAGNILGTYILLLFLLSLLTGGLGAFGILLWAIFLIGLLPILLAVGYSIWVGTRSSAAPAVRS